MSDLLEKEKRAIKLLRTQVEFDNGEKKRDYIMRQKHGNAD